MALERLAAAERLIDEGHYDEARAILEDLDLEEARVLLAQMDANSITLPRLPFLLLIILGALIPIGIVIVLAATSGSLSLPAAPPPPTRSMPTIAPTVPVFPTLTSTPTLTLTPTLTPTATATRELPATWTPTSIFEAATADATGTALIEFVATGQALVGVTQTLAARNANLARDEVLGVVGTPDAECRAASREWWRLTRLLAVDAFNNVMADHKRVIDRIVALPDTHDDLAPGLADGLVFVRGLRREMEAVAYPACAHTAREMLRGQMQSEIMMIEHVVVNNLEAYNASREQAAVFAEYLARELQILGAG